MKIGPYLIIAVVAIFLVVRLRRRAGRSGRGGGTGNAFAARWQVNSEVGIVAAREVRERMRSRTFRVGTGFILLAIVAAVVIPVARRGHHSHETVGIVGSVSAPIRASIVAAGGSLGTPVVLKDEPTIDAARGDLQGGRVNVVLVETKSVLVKTAQGSSTSSTTALLARTIAATVSLQAGLESAGIPPARAAQLAHPKPLPITGLHVAHNQTERTTTLYGLILVFVLLTQYGTWILMGVVEEKSSRVIEVLLSTLRPVQLLTGKVIGIGLVALTQAVLIVGVALGLGAAVGSDLLRGSAPLNVVDSLAWLLLGYVFYCWVYAAAGSLATRQEHLQTVAFPLQIPLLLGYITSLTTLGSDSPSTFIKVLAYFPPTAPFDMPALVTLGRATWWQVAISAALTIVATVGVARLAAAVYLRAILQTRTRVKIRDIWRGSRSPRKATVK